MKTDSLLETEKSFRNREINDIVYYVQEEKTVFDIWIPKKSIIVH